MNKCIEEKTGRLRYFDALRGFSMIFVVFSHVVLFSMGLTDVKDSTVNWVIMTFRMPLFFFVSGFFAYRVCTKWTASLVGDVIKRKIQAQVIGTIVFPVPVLSGSGNLYMAAHGFPGILVYHHPVSDVFNLPGSASVIQVMLHGAHAGHRAPARFFRLFPLFWGAGNKRILGFPAGRHIV